MTREDALRECERLADEDGERATHSWLPKELSPGEWTAVKVDVPPARSPEGAELRADERPPTGNDPRPAAYRNVPPFGAG